MDRPGAWVELTPGAADLLRRLREAHGPLMFHQSGGCCDGSAPMCYPAGEFRTGAADVLLASLHVTGVAEPVPFWMSKAQYERWSHTRLIVDVVPGRGSGFSWRPPEASVSSSVPDSSTPAPRGGFQPRRRWFVHSGDPGAWSHLGDRTQPSLRGCRADGAERRGDLLPAMTPVDTVRHRARRAGPD